MRPSTMACSFFASSYSALFWVLASSFAWRILSATSRAAHRLEVAQLLLDLRSPSRVIGCAFSTISFLRHR